MAGTLAGDHLLRNHPTFAPSDFFDFLVHEKDAIGASRFASRMAAFLSVAIQMFFAGGIIAVLGRGPFSFASSSPGAANLWHHSVLLRFLPCLVASPGPRRLAALLTAPRGDSPLRRIRSFPVALVSLAVSSVESLSLLYDFAGAAAARAAVVSSPRYRFALRALRGSWLPRCDCPFWFLTGPCRRPSSPVGAARVSPPAIACSSSSSSESSAPLGLRSLLALHRVLSPGPRPWLRGPGRYVVAKRKRLRPRPRDAPHALRMPRSRAKRSRTQRRAEASPGTRPLGFARSLSQKLASGRAFARKRAETSAEGVERSLQSGHRNRHLATRPHIFRSLVLPSISARVPELSSRSRAAESRGLREDEAFRGVCSGTRSCP